MLKKNEVLEILENGGYILMNTIYRTADVYNASGLHEDNCRYDTADRIGRTDGYTRENGGWSYTDRIEKTAQEVKDNEPAQEAAQNEEENDMNEKQAIGFVQAKKNPDGGYAVYEYRQTIGWSKHCGFDTLADADRAAAAHAAELAGILNYRPAQEEPAADQQQPDEIEQEPIYLNERVPTSNSIPGIFYRVTIETNHGRSCTDHYTVDDLQTFIQDAKRHGYPIRAAYRVNTETGDSVPFIPETRQEKTDRENREHCKHIADELDAYVNGLVYECPECGEHVRIDDLDALTTETEDGETLYRLPCGCTVDEEPEQRDMYDFLADVFDIEYRIEHSDRETVRSVRVMVAFGGPNIYIDSATRNVELYWWTDRASYPISSDAADALDEWAQELWSCC